MLIILLHLLIVIALLAFILEGFAWLDDSHRRHHVSQ